MQEVLRESMAYVGGAFGKRFTKRQKIGFVRYAKRQAKRMGWDMEYVPFRSAGRECGHLVFGDLEEAENVVAAAYDTPSRILRPGSQARDYYPLDRRKNRRLEAWEMGFRYVAAALCFILYIALAYRRIREASGSMEAAWFAATAGMAAVIFKILAGFGNRYNFRRSSACVAVILDRMKEGKDGKTAYVLLDRAAASWDGFSMMPQELKRKMQKRRFIWLDCLGAGGWLCLAGRRQALLGLLGTGELPAEDGDAGGLRFLKRELSEEEAQNTPLADFPSGVCLIQADEKAPEILVRDTRCGRDDKTDFKQLAAAERFLLQMIESGG